MSNLFKLPKHSRFSYIPRHYDPDKEELQERIKRAKIASQNDPDGMKMRISKGLNQRFVESGTLRKKAVLRSNMTILMIVGILLVSIILLIGVVMKKYPALIDAVK